MTEPVKKLNAVYCCTCGQIVVSLHVHDFRACACPPETYVCVDGGFDYVRRVFGNKARWIENGNTTVSGYEGEAFLS